MRKDIKILLAFLSFNIVYILLLFIDFNIAIILYPVYFLLLFVIIGLEIYIFFRKKLIYKFDTIPNYNLYFYRFFGGLVSFVLIYILMFLTSFFIELSGGKLNEMSMVFLVLVPFWPAGAFLIGDKIYIKKIKNYNKF